MMALTFYFFIAAWVVSSIGLALSGEDAPVVFWLGLVYAILLTVAAFIAVITLALSGVI